MPPPLQTVQDGRQFLKYVDPRLGVPLPERDYGGNCLIYDADNKTDPFHNVWVGARRGTAGLMAWGPHHLPRVKLGAAPGMGASGTRVTLDWMG